jgi:hypothetical protein
MDDPKKLDDELADFTDALIEGRTMNATADMQGLDQTVRLLNEVIRPDGKPDAAFRARLTQKMNEEWAMAHPRKIRWFNQPAYRFGALAAGLVIVLLGLLVTNPGRVQNQGTGSGSVPDYIVVVAVVVVAGIAFYLWRGRR